MTKREVQKLIAYWKATAEHDYETMLSLFKMRRYSDCLFFGRLFIPHLPRIPRRKARDLFGSYAKGTPRKWSDIDICVVSRIFAGRRWLENEQQLWHLRRGLEALIEPYGMSPEEFKSNVSPMAHEVRTTGIRVA